MRTAHVQFVHASRLVSFADARRVVRAVRKQAREHFGPAYALRADAELVPHGRQDPRAWQIVIADDLARAEDEGWHELTSAGMPLGKVLVRECVGDPGGWSSVASHELLELLADPDMSHVVVVQVAGGSRLYAYEVCDAVQDDRWGYDVDGVRVSDFVLPSWFEAFRRPRSVAFDQKGACARPLQVLAGGYAQICHADWERGWRDLGPSRGKIGHSRGSRRGRRRVPKKRWRKSEA